MAKKKPTPPENPKAFPLDTPSGYNPGMTLRDYFAAKAMQGIASASDCAGRYTLSGAWEFMAKESYLIADAMLKARES